ncbi:hypothetical protein VR7878_00054 [Vibrio ruber DSM 16370]|uniref:Uncharacterized protein n=1 Tax=Vibrio ruber (strain DSM 16370 / JCM 11486 / BCRC 17186 / CECT 7878 / LMG 23124 / VR1) TaxID=1123498 RepID=A0A1R4L8K8_VIBR1|nr:hypothetical protein VR7878_00054 [Vibrio ruber DSM 16370]
MAQALSVCRFPVLIEQSSIITVQDVLKMSSVDTLLRLSSR